MKSNRYKRKYFKSLYLNQIDKTVTTDTTMDR